MENTEAVQQVYTLQAELDNVAAVLRNYAAENLKIYKDAKEELGVEWHLQSFYFTFGTAKQYPYTREQYLIVKAQDIREAARKYKKKYPNPYDNEVLNCADYYGQKEWDEYVKKYYEGTEPVEIIE